MNNIQERTLALAGVFNIATMVQELSSSGYVSPALFDACIQSIFVTDPQTTLEVFGDIKNLQNGILNLINQFTGNASRDDIDIARYVMSMLYLERRLSKQPAMLEKLGRGIEAAKRQAEHFSATHENVIANLADLYTQTISELGPRIMVAGEERHLRVPENANKIRALLLAGIRAAVLWHQLGGRRWHLLFLRQRYVTAAKALRLEIL